MLGAHDNGRMAQVSTGRISDTELTRAARGSTMLRLVRRDSTPQTPQAPLAAILLCFFLSGAAGLIYQVAWGKSLGLIFGNTVYAIATVLAVFMGGLAVGSAVMGRWSERYSNALALYGWIEIIVAAGGALSLLGLAGVRWLYVAAYDAAAGFAPALVGLRFVGAALVLFVPTFLMGGTLPILVQGLTRNAAELGARVSRLYWVNTLGAVAGTFAAGFLLLPQFGLKRTVGVAVVLNLLAGAIALLVARRAPVAHAPPAARTPEVAPVAVLLPANSDADPAMPRFLLAVFALVGATAIVYEVCWTRLLSTIVGSSTYAFTLMLGIFLLGIVVGSALFELWVRRSREVTLRAFAITQTWTALAALAFLFFFQKFPELVPPILRATKDSFTGLLLVQFVMSALAMLPAALAFGFNFPIVTVLIAGRDKTSARYAPAVGRAYAANTLGAIAGAVLAGFWLVPQVGAFRLVAFAAAANLLLAVLLEIRRQQRSLPVAAIQAALLAFVVWVASSGAFYNRDLAMYGTVIYWKLYNQNLTQAEAAATTDTIFSEDGMNATISVVRTEGYIGQRTNGKVDASNRDIGTQLMMAHLGGIFHPAPRRVLVIGFGSGMTVAALARYPEIEQITVVEIEPAVLRAAAHLEELNHGVLRNPRVRAVADDGRNFLLTTRDSYDLIVSEPSNPWIAGVASLFTDEFYRAALARLTPGGMFVQWVQGYSLFAGDLRMVFGTFASHFPQVSLWRGESSDFLLLGQTRADTLTLDRVRALWSIEALREDFEALGMRRPDGVIGYHRLDDDDLRKMIGDFVPNTDDHTRLEYNAPRALLVERVEDSNRELVVQHRSRLLPAAIRIDDRNAALLAAAETLLNFENSDEAEYFLRPLASAPTSPELELLRGRWALSKAQYADARQAYQAALSLDRNSLEAALGLGEVARRQFDYDSAELLFRQILARDPNYHPALDNMALMERARANWQQAVAWQARAIAASRAPAAVDFSRMGELQLRANQIAEAEANFKKALQLEPYSYSGHRNLGEIYRRSGRWQEALPHLEYVARFDPDADPSAYLSLAHVYRNLDRPRDADAALRKGRRIFPDSTELRDAK